MERMLTETDKEHFDEMMESLKGKMDGPVYLSDYVKAEMVLQGFNPINKDDITAYWMSKGIDTNG